MQIGIRELKAKLSEYVRRAQEGEHIEVTDHGEPVARLTSLLPENLEFGTLLRDPGIAYETVPSKKKKGPRSETASNAESTYADLLREAKKYTGTQDSKVILTEALKAYVLKKRRLRIAEAFGQIEYDPGYDYKEQRRRS
jgi:prevent-host-death family protein